MPWVDPVSVSSSRPVEASHSRAVLSAPAVARSFPSGLKATFRHGPVVADQGKDPVASGDVPHAGRPVDVGRGEARTVGAEIESVESPDP